MNKGLIGKDYKDFLSKEDNQFISIDKMFMKFMLDCILAQRNINKLSFQERDSLQRAIDNAYYDGMCMLKGKNFMPRSEVLTTRTIGNIAQKYMEDKWSMFADKLGNSMKKSKKKK